MSFKHHRQALALDLPRPQRYILIEMANCADKDTGECNPGHVYLSRRTRYHISHVRTAIQALIEGRYVEVLEINKRGQPKRYRLTLNEASSGFASDDEGELDTPNEPHGGELSVSIKDNEGALLSPNADEGELGAPNADNEGDIDAPNEAHGGELDLNGRELGSNGGELGSQDPVLDPVLDPKQDLEDPRQENRQAGAHEFPLEFEYYFASIYPVQDGMHKAFEIFQTLNLGLPQLKHMREVVLWHRSQNPKWRPDDKGKHYIPSPARFMEEKRYGDRLPDRARASAPPCDHPPERANPAASGAWFCDCGHDLSPAEADERGLTAEAEASAQAELEQIKAALSKRS